MKKLLAAIFACVLVVFAADFGRAQTINPFGDDPAWYSTDGNSNTWITRRGNLDANWQFGIYDYGDRGDFLALIDNDNPSAQFMIINGDITVSSEDGGLSPGGSLDLTTDNVFGFYFYDTNNRVYDYKYESPTADHWEFWHPDSGGWVTVSDVNPVPIPPTALLFLGGIIGLVGVRRKLMK